MRTILLVLLAVPLSTGCALHSRTLKMIPVVAPCVAADIATTAQNLNARRNGQPIAREANPAFAFAHNDPAIIGASLAISGVAQVYAIDWLNRHDHPKLAWIVAGGSAASHCGAAASNEIGYVRYQ